MCPKPGPPVNGHCPSSQVLVLPTITAPAARRRRTTSASAVATRTSPSIPNRVGTPAMSTSSLTAIGIPSSGSCFTGCASRVGLRGVGQCLLGEDHAECVEGGLARGDGVQGLTYEFVRSDCAAGKLVKLVGQGGEKGRRRVRSRVGSRGFGHHFRGYRRCITEPVTPWCDTVTMRLYRDRAVVLRQHKLGEADRIVTLLTRDHGLVRAVAKGFGVPAASSAHGWSRLPTSTCSCIRDATSTSSPRFRPSTRSPPTSSVTTAAYTSACAMLETAERLAGEEHAPMPDLHRLTVAALRAVADGRRARELVLDSLSVARDDDRRVGAGADRVRPLRHAGSAPRHSTSPPAARVRALSAQRIQHPAAARTGADVGAARG